MATFPGGPISQPQLSDAAYRRAYERGLAIADPARTITVNVSSNVPLSDKPDGPRRISFSTRQDTTMQKILSEIHERLPRMDHPFTIMTVGANAQRLDLDTQGEVMEFLQPWDATFLNLRLNIQDPALEKPPKKSLGSRLRKAFGGHDDGSRDPAGTTTSQPNSAAARPPSLSSQQSAPPPYEEANRSTQ